MNNRNNIFKTLFSISKIIFSLGLVGFIMLKIDYEAIKNLIGTINGIKALLVATTIILVQNCVGGARLPYILQLYDQVADVFTGIRIWLVGGFFTQTMISFVGGDAMRVWCLRQAEIPMKTAASAILLDRVIGFFALIFLFLIVLPCLFNIIPSASMRYSVLLLAVTSTVAIILFFLLGFIPSRLRKMKGMGIFLDLFSNSRYLLFSIKSSLIAFILSIGVQLLNIVAIYEIFYFYNIDVSFFWCLVLAIPAMLTSMFPISVAGWGVRETAMITSFALIQIPSDIVLATSITFGLAVALGSLPGVLVFLVERKKRVAGIISAIK